MKFCFLKIYNMKYKIDYHFLEVVLRIFFIPASSTSFFIFLTILFYLYFFVNFSTFILSFILSSLVPPSFSHPSPLLPSLYRRSDDVTFPTYGSSQEAEPLNVKRT